MNTDQPSPEPTETKPVRRKSSGAFWGLALIIVGIVIIAQQTGLLSEHFNWWALFILIPAFGSFAGAFSALQNTGKFNAAARSGIGGGIVFLTIALMFLFNLDWELYWPVVVIAFGFSFFLNGFETGKGAVSLVTISLWIGLGGMFLGLGFLADNLHWLDPQAFFGNNQWWAVAILIVGVGSLINALFLAVRTGKFFGVALAMATFGLLVTATGVVAYLGISWNLLGPLLLIVLGISIMLGIFTHKK